MKSSLAAALLLVLPVSAQPPTHTLQHWITGPIEQTNTWSSSGGRSVAVAGNFIVVGSPYDDTDEADAGIVRVYGIATGLLYFVLHNPTPAVDDRFGFSVAIAAAVGGIHRVVVGAHNDDTGATDAGSAYVFNISSVLPDGGGTNYSVGSPSATHTLNNPMPFLDDRFGGSVAISGTKAVIGADGNDLDLGQGPISSAGSAYVYELATTNTTPTVPVATLDNPNPVAADHFGEAVAISGNRVVVGVPDHDFNATLTNSGRAYLYDISTVANPMVPRVTLDNPTPAISDDFGEAVAISSTRVAVGAPDDDHSLVLLDAGSAYVYDLSGSGASTTAGPPGTVTHPYPAAGDHFGTSLAMSSGKLVVGAPDDDVLYGSTTVTLSNCTTTTDFPGTTVTCADTTGLVPGMQISGDNIAGGTTVASVINPTSFVLSQAATASGSSLTLTASESITDLGSAYVYNLTSSGTLSTPEATLSVTLNEPAARAYEFGRSVAILVSGARAAVGAPGADTSGTDEGGAYSYDLAVTPPTNKQFQGSSPDNFGTSVAISGTRMVVGVPYAYGEKLNSPVGRVYVYDTSGATPTLLATLDNPTPGAYDFFGWSVAISGSRVVVGAQGDNPPGSLYVSGSAYVYDLVSLPLSNCTTNTTAPGTTVTCNSTTGLAPGAQVSGPNIADGTTVASVTNGTSFVLSQAATASGSSLTLTASYALVATLPNPSPASGDLFGASVAISGTKIVVGAWNDDTGATNAGSAYVFDIASGNPTTPITTLNNPSPSVDDAFGISVTISGTRVVVGASDEGDDVPNPTPPDSGQRDQGRAYMYDFSGGFPTSAPPTFTLNNPSPEDQDFFGTSVAVSGTRVVVGAPYDNTGASYAGSAYVYDFSGATPPTVPTPTVLNEAAQNAFFFGSSVAIDGTLVVVGSPLAYYTQEVGSAGRSYVYDVSSGTPATSVATLNNPSPVEYDDFGQSVAISGTTIAVGAPKDDTTVLGTPDGDVTVYDKGAAYIFLPIYPEILVEQPAGTSLTNGAANLTFGNVGLGSGSPMSFTIRNTGPDPLTIYSVTVTGDHAGDFPVTTTGMLTSVPADGNTTFSVAFTPAALGSRMTTLRIVNNDSDEGTFTITLTGTGVDTTPPVLTLPANIVAEATSPTGLAVTYSMSATDSGSGVATSGFLPASGSTFPIGTTTVNASATDLAGNIATGSFTVTVQSAQQTWRKLHFGSTENSGNGADGVDPDFDGIQNLLEWGCNLNPTTASTLPATVVRNGTNLEFTYNRSVAAMNAGVVFTVEWSDTLPGPNPWSSVGVTESILSNDGTMQQVKATIPVGTPGRCFVHLKVTAPPPTPPP